MSDLAESWMVEGGAVRRASRDCRDRAAPAAVRALDRSAAPGARFTSDAGGVRGADWTHPRGWVVAVASAAWIAIIPHQSMGHAAHAPHHAADPAASGWMMVGMVVAMMVPMTLAHVREVASRNAEWRHRAVAVFLLGYLAVWTVAQAVIAETLRGIAALSGWLLAACIAAAAAVAWELGRGARPIRVRIDPDAAPPGGWRAHRVCVSHGTRTAVRCVGSCWGLMAVCAALPHSFSVMSVLFVIQMSGRHGASRSPALSAVVVLTVWVCAIGARLTDVTLP